MEDFLLSILDKYGYPVIRQGSLAANEPFPDTFFTFWSNNSYDGSHYDNKAASVIWDWDVNLYSTYATKTYDLLTKVINDLKTNDFIISGYGHDLVSDEITHTGRGVNVLYRQTNKED